ncbi:PAS domain S-box protein [Variovorax sp. J31P179]|uniref:PAS domain S-box protein n=1 Tax=Variovorax sp. J31P179 TaxID=3053508 RepID=UPI002576D031|nr:PAS domain S-box protein [Variovorax sp. J31P179]MDM0082721.1 PAS domain S-box protein [Variovorax sp. J31P179]
MAAPDRRHRATDTPAWTDAAEAMYRAARAVAGAHGPGTMAALVQELAQILGVATVFVAVFTDGSRSTLRTLAAVLDGKILRNFDYPLQGSPCAQVVGRAFRFVASGVAREFPPGTMFAAKAMDSYAAFPLNDSDGRPLGLLVAMDPRPIEDAVLAEALLKIFASRLIAEIERSSADEALRAAALAVSAASGRSVFAELARYLATILDVEMAFISRHQSDDDASLHMLAMVSDGEVREGYRYPIQGTPCEYVLGQRFCVYPSNLHTLFALDQDDRLLGAEGYAGLPLNDAHGRPLGTIGIVSRHALTNIERIESMLRIFAGRAAAEIEQLGAREALQRSEASYRAIFEASEDAVFILDWSSGEILDANPKACEAYGCSRDELCRLSLADLRSGEAPYTAEQGLAHMQLAKLGRCPPFEWHRRSPDGALRWDEVRLKPAMIDGRHHVVAFTRDITERKEALAALAASEAQYRGIFNASADALVLRAANFAIVDANATYERMSGFRLSEVLGVDRVLANPPEIMATIRALHDQALAGEPVRLETELLRRDGERYDLELRGVPVLHRGEPHVLYIGRDMTQSKRAERALRNSEEQYRAIFNASADGLVVRDAGYRAVDVNPAYLAMSGYTRDEVLSATRVLTQPDPALQQRHRAQHADILAGRPVRFEVPGVRKDGSPFYLEVSGMPLTYRGEPHVLYAARDITQRKAAEGERERLEAQLRQAQKMEAIGQLTGGIAHDFNNILTSVIGYLVLGQERAETLGDARLQRQLGQAQLAAQRARELIAQMLAFARRQRGQRRTLALGPLVDQTLQLLRATLPASVSLDFATPPAAGGDALLVAADAVQLEQVLFNLCINARDAITGSGWIRVRLGRRGGAWTCASCRAHVDAGHWVEVSVADSGGGIAPDLLERIFEPFTSSKEVGRGSGMGLAMVHGIVHDHGGHVLVETAPGAGSVFRVLLPPATGAAPDAPGAPDVPATGEALCARVMVVDDEVMVGDFMVELLSGWGLEVVLQRSPLDALSWLEDSSQPLDLLITDQTMPQLDGLQLAQRASGLRPHLPVLLYTGNADGIDEAAARRHGVCGVLHKPIDNQALHALMKACLDKARRGLCPGA